MKSLASILVLLLGLSTLLAGETRVEPWGETPEGETILLYHLRNANGLEARVMTYGATLVGLDAPDRNGKFANLTLHLDSAADYVAGHPLLGSVVGRYANRIDKGGFSINGERFDLETVNAKTGVHIHGGKTGFQWQNWTPSEVGGQDYQGVKLELVSPDGHEGFPGEVRVSVTYTLNDDDELQMHYEATTTKPTHINLTNHAYWNLAGAGSGTVLNQKLQINAARYLEVDERKIPTGRMIPVMHSVMDFTLPRRLGPCLDEVEGGYDHCYAINHLKPGDLSLAAKLIDRRSGREMEVWTTAPGVQVYTANGLKDKFGAGGKSYGPRHGICLETQHFPDSPNKLTFPSTLLLPGKTYEQITVHKFCVKD